MLINSIKDLSSNLLYRLTPINRTNVSNLSKVIMLKLHPE